MTSQTDKARQAARAPTVSVVVCTIGRMDVLPSCLAALRAQTQQPAEILVVLGPDGEPAAGYLAEQDDVQLVRTPARNVSVARNAGLARARGDVVAFCDDDAAAEADWLACLAEPFQAPTVGAAGGTVYDARTDPPVVVFRNGLLRLSGRQRPVRADPGEHNDPAGPWYNTVCGCSCAFRRDLLTGLGGFDPFFEFAFDEADVCVRVIRAKQRVVHVPQAVVQHARAAGGFRRNELERNWYCELKNQVYFGLKHRLGACTAGRTLLRATVRAIRLAWRFRVAAGAGSLAPRQAGAYVRDLWRGMAAGLAGARRLAPRGGPGV